MGAVEVVEGYCCLKPQAWKVVALTCLLSSYGKSVTSGCIIIILEKRRSEISRTHPNFRRYLQC